MSLFDEYATKYKTARMDRRNGVLQVTLHTDGQSLRWGFLPHSELPDAFHDIGTDRENRVVILTGTGDEFSGPRATQGTSSFPTRPSIERIDRIHWEGRVDAIPVVPSHGHCFGDHAFVLIGPVHVCLPSV